MNRTAIGQDILLALIIMISSCGTGSRTYS